MMKGPYDYPGEDWDQRYEAYLAARNNATGCEALNEQGRAGDDMVYNATRSVDQAME